MTRFWIVAIVIIAFVGTLHAEELPIAPPPLVLPSPDVARLERSGRSRQTLGAIFLSVSPALAAAATLLFIDQYNHCGDLGTNGCRDAEGYAAAVAAGAATAGVIAGITLLVQGGRMAQAARYMRSVSIAPITDGRGVSGATAGLSLQF